MRVPALQVEFLTPFPFQERLMVFDARNCFSPRLDGSILLSFDFVAVLACLAVQLYFVVFLCVLCVLRGERW